MERNLWSQAEFDSVTAKKLCELRAKYWPDTVQLPPEQMGEVLRDLYSRGATIVSSEQGYGIYFRREDTLYFVEMMAENDRAAEVLMEAAREKEVIVEKAVITVGAGPESCSWAREPGRSMASSALKENLLMFRRATCA